MNKLKYLVLIGELLETNIFKLIFNLLKYKNFGQLKVNTNGTIIPKDEKLKVFQNDKVFCTTEILGHIYFF